ncbi:Transposable element P transposase, partial [Paramuricea clavata]
LPTQEETSFVTCSSKIWNSAGITISGNQEFKKSNVVLNAKQKSLKQGGKENVQHKPPLEPEDLQKLKTSGVFDCSSPLGLLRNVWFSTVLFWCRRGREGQRNLTRESFVFAQDPTGEEYATMTHSEASKNHPGGIKDSESFQHIGRMYQTNEENDGYSALKLYISKLNPACEALFQYPKRNWKPDDKTWYENRPLGINKLGDMMKDISTAAGLSKIYTNHCVRATSITLWSNAGLTNRHIMSISGHRNEQSLQHYNRRPSTSQLKRCSEVLSEALGPIRCQLTILDSVIHALGMLLDFRKALATALVHGSRNPARKTIRYHPHIIRFCLSLHAKSPAAYKELRESGVLVLPSERTLRDYRNFFKPRAGFHRDNVERLKNQTSQYFDIQRYVVLSFDEMKIQSKLVFDKHSNELIEFADLGEEELNVSSGSSDPATHALVFFVRGAASDLKYALAYFLTKDVTSYQIMPLFWKAVSILELLCNLWVCAAVSDEASPNRLFYQLHANLIEPDVEVVHYTPNLFVPGRNIYFFSDAPHLLKTTRNCLFNSGSGKRTRSMWNNGKYLLWEHIAKLYNSDLDSGLNQLPKLTVDHIALKSYSKMKVSMAVQVLSNTVAQALQRHYSSAEAQGTANLCKMMNDFFDCMNVRSTTEYQRKRNALLAPYRSADDERFDWLQNLFLEYLTNWKSSTESREGAFTDDDRGRMFLIIQTFKGLTMTVKSAIAITKCLLSEGFEFVLTERFCQDDVEEYFGYQRAQGRRSDNPSAAEFGYNDLRIATLRDVAPQSIEGNVSGRHSGKKSRWCNVSDEPLPKKNTKKKP